MALLHSTSPSCSLNINEVFSFFTKDQIKKNVFTPYVSNIFALAVLQVKAAIINSFLLTMDQMARYFKRGHLSLKPSSAFIT